MGFLTSHEKSLFLPGAALLTAFTLQQTFSLPCTLRSVPETPKPQAPQ